MTRERTRGVTIKTLDMTPLYERVAKDAREKIRPDVTAVKTPYNWALGTTPQGRTFLICDEGVYWPIGNGGEVRPAGEDGPFEFDVWDATERHNDEGHQILEMMSFATVNVSLDDVELLVSGEVDLVDFIRVFGDRLERNFWIARKELSGE